MRLQVPYILSGLFSQPGEGFDDRGSHRLRPRVLAWRLCGLMSIVESYMPVGGRSVHPNGGGLREAPQLSTPTDSCNAIGISALAACLWSKTGAGSTITRLRREESAPEKGT